MFKRTHLAPLAVAAAFAAIACSAAPASAATFGTFENTTPISVPAQGSATPSEIPVSGMDGPLDRITVSLNGVTHAKPEDLDVLLVSPRGQKVILASDVCGASATSNRNWVFPTFGVTEFMSITGPCGTAAYRPTNENPNGFSDSWPGEPAGIYQDYVRMLKQDANGTWRLFVVDDNANNSGSLAGGWTLGLESVAPDVRLPAIGTFGVTDPYPMRTTVSGQNGIVADVNVFVGPLWHERLDDLDIYLAGPQGQQATLMSDSCGDAVVPAQDWEFDDDIARPAPDGATSDCGRARFSPTDNGPLEPGPPGGPPGPWEPSLGAFDGTDPNGEWRLYAYDSADGKAGWIADNVIARAAGFRVVPTIRPRAQVAFADPAVTVTEGETAQLVVTRAAEGKLGAGTVTLTAAPGTATAGEDYGPAATGIAFAAGETSKTVSVETIADELAEGDETLTLTVAQGTGDAQPGTPATADVTIRDRERPGGDDPQGGGGVNGGEVDTIIRKAPKRKTARRKAKVLFDATESDATFECKLDRRAFKPCGSPRKLQKLRTGRHVFLVRAVDAAGNADPTPAKRRWRVVGG